MEDAKAGYQGISESELFAYIRRNSETAQELYCALAGIEDDGIGRIELREKAGAYFLVKEGGATFAFPKQKPELISEP